MVLTLTDESSADITSHSVNVRYFNVRTDFRSDDTTCVVLLPL